MSERDPSGMSWLRRGHPRRAEREGIRVGVVAGSGRSLGAGDGAGAGRRRQDQAQDAREGRLYSACVPKQEEISYFSRHACR